MASAMRLVEIAALLGVSKRQAHETPGRDGFPHRSPRATVATGYGIDQRLRCGRRPGDETRPWRR
jgi:hypothetical protein